MQSYLLLFCLMLTVTLSWSNAMPVPFASASGPHDVRWRLVSGMETAYKYAIKLQQQLCDSEPLLNASYKLEGILSGVCELLEWHEFIAQEMNGSDYHAVLEQNILDSCNWFNYLVTSGEVSPFSRFLNLSDSCELGNMPRLSQYCLEANLRNSSRVYNIVNNKIYTPLSNYYSGIVVNVNISQWIEAGMFSPRQKDSIELTLTQNLSCISDMFD